MSSEKERILKMLEEGKLTPEDAAKLLSVLGIDDSAPQRPVAPQHPAVPRNPALKGKKLRVKVEGGGDNMRVNVAVPLALARLAGGIMGIIPKEATKAMEEQGINLSSMDFGAMIDELADTDEDIVNVEMNDDGYPMTVRIYVE